MYISVVADNGFGVFTNKTKLEYAKEWMLHPVEKVFDTYREAKFHALEIYNDYHNAYEDLDDYYDADNDPEFKINWFYSKTYIRRLNKR